MSIKDFVSGKMPLVPASDPVESLSQRSQFATVIPTDRGAWLGPQRWAKPVVRLSLEHGTEQLRELQQLWLGELLARHKVQDEVAGGAFEHAVPDVVQERVPRGIRG